MSPEKGANAVKRSLVEVVKHKRRGKQNRSEVAELGHDAIVLEAGGVIVDNVKERRGMAKVVNCRAAMESYLGSVGVYRKT